MHNRNWESRATLQSCWTRERFQQCKTKTGIKVHYILQMKTPRPEKGSAPKQFGCTSPQRTGSPSQLVSSQAWVPIVEKTDQGQVKDLRVPKGNHRPKHDIGCHSTGARQTLRATKGMERFKGTGAQFLTFKPWFAWKCVSVRTPCSLSVPASLLWQPLSTPETESLSHCHWPTENTELGNSTREAEVCLAAYVMRNSPHGSLEDAC